MERKWTVEQKQAIDARNRNLLVSAAAGSGKTAVLVQRILSIVLDEKNPVDIDRLLVVTFTRAAAAEMKERIGQGLEEMLAENPDNAHLQRQLTLLHHGQICTIDSFCSYILKNYFYIIDLDPGFRVGDEGEISLLKGDVLEKLLEEQFSLAQPEFLKFVDYFATGKQDSNLEQLIMQLSVFSESHPNPEKWLDECAEFYKMTTMEQLEQSVMGKAFTKQIVFCLKDLYQRCKEVRQIILAPDGPYYFESALNGEAVVISQLLETDGWQNWYEILAARKAGRLTTPKNATGSQQLKELVEEEIRAIRQQLKDLQGTFFEKNPNKMLEELHICRPVVDMLIWLTKEFQRRLFEKKKEKNVYDFSDLEHMALQVLVDEKGNPTEVALAFRDHFAEVMIDEYQDSNLLQEHILTAVSKSGLATEEDVDQRTNNLFMVGDMKQSIYRFRQACPRLFTEKYYRYTKEESPNQIISLRQNFRSRKQVLDSANDVFYRLMQRQVGNIDYDEDAALFLGAEYEEGSSAIKDGQLANKQEFIEFDNDYRSEVFCFSTETMPTGSQRQDVIATEAQMIANRIVELTDKQTGLFVGGKEHGRIAQYKDIIILLRSKGLWADTFVNTLMDAGIPAYAESTTGFYKTREIQTILNYLSLMDNERQEIPLAAVLASPIGGFSSLQLAKIKGAFPDCPFYEGCRSYSVYGMEENLRNKLAAFYKQLDEFRQMISYTSIHDILWKLYDETGFYDFASAMPGGNIRQANLDMLIHQAFTFEKTSYTGLFQFLRYIERIQKYDIDIGEASGVQESMNAVRIMTIHKSKGLEFPIVFLAGLGKHFNDQDEKQPVVLHGESGIGVDAIDLENRTKRTTSIKRILRWQNHLENRAEEIRILYVAMTRAREKLILTVGHKEAKSPFSYYLGENRKLSFQQVVDAKSMWDWLYLIVGGSEHFVQREKTYDEIYDVESFEDDLKDIHESNWEETDFDALMLDDENIQNWQDVYDRLLEKIIYEYPTKGQTYNAKLSVSELKKRASHEQDDEMEWGQLYKEPTVVPYLPKFASPTQETKAVEKGTAYHKLLECMDYEMEPVQENVEKLLHNLVEQGIMEPSSANTIDSKQIVTFLHSAIGQRMKVAALKGKLKREQPFVFGIPAQELHEAAEEGEKILIQGIIDGYFEEDGQLVIVDYKTDRVSRKDGAEKLLKLYQVQLQYYARALQQLTNKPVKAAYIYSFALEEQIICQL